MLNPEIVTNRRLVDRLARDPRLRKAAAAWQPVVKSAVDEIGVAAAGVLHGTFLGHSLHLALTDIPVGAWSVSAILDALELAGRPVPPAASDAALTIGVFGALGAIVTGWADWSDTKDDPRTVGMAHAMLNGIGFTGYLGALALNRAGRRRGRLLLALASYAATSAAAYLGGELSTSYQLGVKHTAEPIDPSTDFVRVIAEQDVPASGAVRVDFGGVPLLVSRRESAISAIGAACTHRGAPLDQGTFEDGCVTCPWHGSRFALDDGRVIDGPATFPQPRFEARINGDGIEVRALPIA